MVIEKILILVAILATCGLTIGALITLLFKEGLIKVNPRRNWVVKNLWTGIPRALDPGTHLIIPGWEEKLMEVTLENEPSDPRNAKVITGDAVEIEADYVIYHQEVVDAVKAATVIDYKKRTELIEKRIVAYFQNEFSGHSLEDFFTEEGLKKTLDKDKLKDIEDAVNNKLLIEVEKQWGINVEIQIENLRLPDKAREVAEEAATAEKEGQRIAKKAEKAGVAPELIVWGDIAYDVARAIVGGLKK